MNKQYIKRQIVLHKLGIPMDEDIKEYYIYFNSLIGEKDKLEELLHEDYPGRIFWKRDSKVILEYIIKTGHFFVDIADIWAKFEEKYGLNYDSISELIGSMLEETFKLKVTTQSRYLPLILDRWEKFSN